jgi:hypothetical protein
MDIFQRKSPMILGWRIWRIWRISLSYIYTSTFYSLLAKHQGEYHILHFLHILLLHTTAIPGIHPFQRKLLLVMTILFSSPRSFLVELKEDNIISVIVDVNKKAPITRGFSGSSVFSFILSTLVFLFE